MHIRSSGLWWKGSGGRAIYQGASLGSASSWLADSTTSSLCFFPYKMKPLEELVCKRGNGAYYLRLGPCMSAITSSLYLGRYFTSACLVFLMQKIGIL